MASPSCVYDPLEDSEFDETDSDNEEEQDATDNDEEKPEQGEEESDNNEQDEFKDAEEHNNTDDQYIGTSTIIYNDSDPLFGDIPEEEKDLIQSPVSLEVVFCFFLLFWPLSIAYAFLLFTL